jgi:hypothetical protein
MGKWRNITTKHYAIVEVVGVALRAVSSRDARGFFEHRGYHPLAQPL